MLKTKKHQADYFTLLSLKSELNLFCETPSYTYRKTSTQHDAGTPTILYILSLQRHNILDFHKLFRDVNVIQYMTSELLQNKQKVKNSLPILTFGK